MAIIQNHAWSGDESKRLCDLVFGSLPRDSAPRREYSSYCKGTILQQKPAMFWIKHTKHTIILYPVCEDAPEIMGRVRELLPSGVTLRVRPFPRKAIALSTPLFFKIESEAQAQGIGPLLRYLSDHRPNSSEKIKPVTSTAWLQPSESEGGETHPGTEGNRISVLVNRYERNPKNRKICIRHYGAICKACDFDFSATYGDIGIGYIHVHHLHPLAGSDGKAKIPDPIKDFSPVCPNCHEMLHRGDPLHPKTIEQLKEIIARVKASNRKLQPQDSGA
jgi:hypothetical protein